VTSVLIKSNRCGWINLIISVKLTPDSFIITVKPEKITAFKNHFSFCVLVLVLVLVLVKIVALNTIKQTNIKREIIQLYEEHVRC
jgi:hypothetical protein